MVFIITIASSMYHPTSMTYITKLIPSKQRKRFNSLRSLLDSGAFLTGPAIAGMLFTVGTPNMAIFINAIALFLSALFTLAMPNLEKSRQLEGTINKKMSLVKADWSIVISFSLQNVYLMIVYFLFSVMIVIMTATLEAAFATQVLSLSEGEYGVLVSIAGAGVFVGSFINTIVVEKIPTSWLISVGSIITAIGYVVFSMSVTFLIASVGCFVLSFATAFANTGFYTFYQNNIPVDMMGRVGSIYGFAEAFLIILATAIFGVAAELIPIRCIVVFGATLMLFVAITLFICAIRSSKAGYYQNVTAKAEEI